MIAAAPSPWKIQAVLIACGLALAVGLFGGAWFCHLYYSPRLDLEKTRSNVLRESIDAQNTAIQDLEKAGRARDARNKAAMAEANKRREAAEQAAQELLSMPAPPPGTDTCKAASELIRRELSK